MRFYLHKNIKGLIPTILILSILTLGFLSLSIIPKVHATTPTMSYQTTGYCGAPCQTGEINEFGTINAFSPASNIGNGLVDEIFCYPGGNINLDPGSQQFGAIVPTFSITSVTDTLGDVWAGIPQQFDSELGYGEYIWYTNIVTTAATTMIIDLNTSPGVVGSCVYELYLITTGISVNNYNGIPGSINSNTGVFHVTANHLSLTSQNIVNPTNTINFISGWLSPNPTTSATGVGIVITNPSPITSLRTENSGVTPQFYMNSLYQYVSSAFVSGYTMLYNLTSMPSGTIYYLGLSVVSFNLGITGSSNCSNQSCGVVGGGSTLDSTTQFTLIANTTYFYTGTTSTGGLTIQNITSKIASYTNGNSGKSTDTYMLAVYSMQASNSFPTAVLSSGNPLSRIFNTNGTVITGTTKLFIHGGTLNVVVAPNTSYAVSIISKFSGLSIYHTINSEPMNYTTDGIFSGANWSPPYNIIDKTTSPFNLYLFWYGITTPNLLTTTTVTTDLTTCALTSTCTVNLFTSWTTTTSTINNLQGGTGGEAMISNLVTYWPIWLIPLFFTPFGIQGVLLGFIFGTLLGGLLGVIPLWAAFILVLVTIYLLSKRF